MQIQLQKIYQIALTGIGLCLFAAALMLNHNHPHNEGIASLTHNAILQKLGISTASSTGGSNLSYLAPLPKTAPKADKIDDPTSASDTQNPSLPAVAEANDADSAQTTSPDDSITVKSNDKSGGDQGQSQQKASAPAASRNN
jgi:hypothetical protein